MQEHFNFTDEEFKSLTNDGITIKHLYDFAIKYDPSGKQVPVGFINLFYYVDDKGDFHSKPDFPTKKICRAIFQKLTLQQKLEISEYISDKLEGDF